MNPGAHKIFENYIDLELIKNTIVALQAYNWSPVWTDKKYAGDHWMTCPLIEEFNYTPNFNDFEIASLIEGKMKCKLKNLMFYAMLPGGNIPPHRDMVGNVGLGGIRLHIPIVTNKDVNFVVAGQRVTMSVGELWALDTSYTHSVSNCGSESRIHIVMDVIINDWMQSLLPPKNVAYYLHQISLMVLGVLRVFSYITNRNLKFADFLILLKKSVKLLIFRK